MKSSNKLFIGFILILLLAPFWFVFLLSQELTDNQPKPGVFDPPSGEQKSYPMAIDSFQYIVADGVTVEFDTGKWQAILETSESLRSLYSIETRNDTLYLSKDPSAPYYGDWALAHVRAPRINGVTVVNGGEIRVEGIEPRFYSRDLTIRMGEGKIYLPVDTDALDLRYDGGGAVMLRGKASRLNVQGRQSPGNLSAFNLKVDSVFVQSCGQTSFQLHVNRYLEADLSNSYGDLVYLGRPIVVKKENARGRVIDGSRMKQ